MGFTYSEVKLYNSADSEKIAKVHLLVGSGALSTSVPKELAQGLGLKPVERRKLKVYRGTAVEYKGHPAGVLVIFGEPQDVSVLGATALESLGRELDPVTKKLKLVELLMP